MTIYFMRWLAVIPGGRPRRRGTAFGVRRESRENGRGWARFWEWGAGCAWLLSDIAVSRAKSVYTGRLIAKFQFAESSRARCSVSDNAASSCLDLLKKRHCEGMLFRGSGKGALIWKPVGAERRIPQVQATSRSYPKNGTSSVYKAEWAQMRSLKLWCRHAAITMTRRAIPAIAPVAGSGMAASGPSARSVPVAVGSRRNLTTWCWAIS